MPFFRSPAARRLAFKRAIESRGAANLALDG
jgi:hypothetical protein